MLNYKDKCNTFLHLAVLKHCDADGIERLVTAGAPVAHRNTDRENFMDLVLSTDYPHKLAVSRSVMSSLQNIRTSWRVKVSHVLVTNYPHKLAVA